MTVGSVAARYEESVRRVSSITAAKRSVFATPPYL
jgi:hypothetical protein